MAIVVIALGSGCASGGSHRATLEPLAGWSPAAIADYVTAANDAEIREAQLALQRSTAGEVRAFAQTIIADHRQANEKTAALLSRLAPVGASRVSDGFSAQNAPPDEAGSAAAVPGLAAQPAATAWLSSAPPPAPGSALTGDGVVVRQPGGVPPIATAALTGDGVKVRSAGIVSGTTIAVRDGAPTAVQEVPPVSPLTPAPNGLGASAALAALQAENARSFSALSAQTEPTFDGAYIADQITLHESLIRMVDEKLLPAAQDHPVRALLKSLRAQAQAHLDLARRVRTSQGL